MLSKELAWYKSKSEIIQKLLIIKNINSEESQKGFVENVTENVLNHHVLPHPKRNT